jgi:AcrR family transcriptional regulator
MTHSPRRRGDQSEAEPGEPATSPRRDQIIRAAYFTIAEEGFEGLRTRDVAGKVGINSATLHYYFRDKEALVQGVVAFMMKELSRPRVAVGPTASALDRLRAEFSDIKARIRDAPEQLIVLTELTLRAFRDPKIAQLLRELDQGWHAHLVSILEAGIAEKLFRTDIDAGATASALMAQLRGLVYQGGIGPKKRQALIDQIALQTERWVRK